MEEVLASPLIAEPLTRMMACPVDDGAACAILAHTEKLPRHLLSVRTDLAPQLVGQLNDVLVAMHDDADGQRILKNTDQTTKFDALPGGEAALRKRLLESFFSPGRE